MRHYDSESGRFISPDPFKGYMGDPASQHPYAYCHGNPVNYADPSGYKEEAYGLNGTKIEWGKSSYRIDPVDANELSFAGKVVSSARGVLQKKFNLMYGSDGYFSNKWSCYSWRSRFCVVDKDATKILTINDFQKRTYKELSDAIQKVTGTTPTSITPYFRQREDIGHTYVYLRFQFENKPDVWLFTEANASLLYKQSIPDGRIPYQTYQIGGPGPNK